MFLSGLLELLIFCLLAPLHCLQKGRFFRLLSGMVSGGGAERTKLLLTLVVTYEHKGRKPEACDTPYSLLEQQ